ncbi:MAG: hypothetical protein H0W12_08915 [Chitinophagaceae bacterium]|nr:hypothetical protein [Chitinophagaceae bacterium]
MRVIIHLFLFSLIYASAFCQGGGKNGKIHNNNTLPLTATQKLADSLQFEKFKKENPEVFLNERLPVYLIDGSYVVPGYSTSIQVKNDHLTDSVYHNFFPGMPDTSTINPFSDIKVAGGQISIKVFSHLLLMGGRHHDSASISAEDEEGKLVFRGKVLPADDFFSNAVAVKASCNGILLYDWTSIKYFPRELSRVSEKFLDFHGGKMFGYAYGYIICNTSLKVNDQLLIEIKSTKNNWMIDRYNITREAIAPTVSQIISSSDKILLAGNSKDQKKTSTLNQVIIK